MFYFLEELHFGPHKILKGQIWTMNEFPAWIQSLSITPACPQRKPSPFSEPRHEISRFRAALGTPGGAREPRFCVGERRGRDVIAP
ncbi:hypothetical protein J1605_000498 [Eschrichtius robustus]|uniref:Uncharacterized protein n=1 Tax=Eschrichtius robustus TaxID=9764 RepID=A0AB34H8T1_ESCRO|nr:hypothetical protein J1605_000498 [Eschrichtius robustus]